MIEFSVDMEYCMDELADGVVVTDEFGELPDMVFVQDKPERTCKVVGMDSAGNPPYNKTGCSLNDMGFGCSECGYPWANLNFGKSLLQCKINAFPRFCPNCGAKVVWDYE